MKHPDPATLRRVATIAKELDLTDSWIRELTRKVPGLTVTIIDGVRHLTPKDVDILRQWIADHPHVSKRGKE